MEPLPKCKSNLVNLRHLKGDVDEISKIHNLGKLKFLQELEEFTVMAEDGHRIEELKDMKKLRGQLHVSHLLHTEEEAKQAKMNEKEHITKLDLCWWESAEDAISEEADSLSLEGLQQAQDEISEEADDLALEALQEEEDGISEESLDSALEGLQPAEDDISEASDESAFEGLQPPEDSICEKSDDSVLEGIQPHQNLKELQILGYSGVKTPSWLQDGYLTKLEALDMFSCRNLDLQLIGQLRCLKSLKIKFLSKLQQLGCRVCEGKEENSHLFPCLRVLHWIHCSSLMELISLPTTLEEMNLENVGLAELPRLHQNKSAPTPSSSSLLSLHISNCHRLTTLQTGLLGYLSQPQLRVLETLIIEGCRKLVYLPDHGFSALKSLKLLHIEKCMKLRYKPVENSRATLPSSLINLEIINCAALTNDTFLMGLERLHSLASMFIRGVCLDVQEVFSPHNYVLSSLPGKLLQHLQTLTQLGIFHCYKLENLGIQSLVSFKELCIGHCPNLVSCSSSVDDSESLPLEFLKIEHSPMEFINRKLLGRLTSLRELQMVGSIMVSFPEEIKDGLHCLTSLKKLHIQGFPNLQSLPDELASIPCLEELYITQCSAVKSLPEMPASLVMLVIDYCHLLRRRYQRGGADWNKIENIFYVQVYGLNVKDPAAHNLFELW